MMALTYDYDNLIKEYGRAERQDDGDGGCVTPST
jgi:hypothetical protein